MLFFLGWTTTKERVERRPRDYSQIDMESLSPHSLIMLRFLSASLLAGRGPECYLTCLLFFSHYLAYLFIYLRTHTHLTEFLLRSFLSFFFCIFFNAFLSSGASASGPPTPAPPHICASAVVVYASCSFSYLVRESICVSGVLALLQWCVCSKCE